MEIKFVTKNYKISDKFKEIIEKKLLKLKKYFTKKVEVKVNCTEQDKSQKLEITLTSSGLFIKSEVISDNMYNNIDLVLPKLEKQIVKIFGKGKTKELKEYTENFEFISNMEPMVQSKIVKTKKFDLEPQTVEDAEFNLEAYGNSFYIFLNAETGKVNVLYKRLDNNLGIIEINY